MSFLSEYTTHTKEEMGKTGRKLRLFRKICEEQKIVLLQKGKWEK